MSWSMMLAVAGGGAMGSLAVNVVGSFLMGMLVELVALRCSVSQETRAFIAVGMLGGFTTFSTFSLDAAVLIERGEIATAFLHLAGSVLAGLAALFMAINLVRQIIAA